MKIEVVSIINHKEIEDVGIINHKEIEDVDIINHKGLRERTKEDSVIHTLLALAKIFLKKYLKLIFIIYL